MRLRVLIRPVDLQGQRLFVAQCLEFNIAVQGCTPQAARDAFINNLVQTYALVREHGARDPFEYLGQGPPDAWRAWDDAFKGAPEPVRIDRDIQLEPALAFAC